MKSLLKFKRKTLVGFIAIIIVLFVFVNLIASVFFSFTLFDKEGSKKFIKYSYGVLEKKEQDWLSEKGKIIEIENSENKALKGIEITNDHVSHSYIIMCHQYGGSPETMVEYAKHFYDLGFNIVLPYLRGHGENPYKNISFGWEDSSDIVDWVNGIIEKDDKAKIVLFGVSMGANAVTLAVAEELPPNVRLAIADSCYTSVEELIKEYIKNETPLSSFVTTKFLSVFAKNKIDMPLKEADTINKVRKIELPIMFINGENDAVVPPILSKKFYENCDAAGVEEVIISEGTHGRNLQTDEETYWANIDAFVLNNIGI